MFRWFRRSKYDYATLAELREVRHELIHDNALLMRHVLRKEKEVANDLSQLSAAIVRLETAVGNLPPPEPNQQPAIDDLKARVDVLSTKLEPVPVP